jgi:branched-chain amino acid transport system ATP-binding protein
MLEVSGLRIAYGAVDVVHGVSLSVGASEAVALLGPNGAGKTSTLRALSRLISFGGTVTFDGHDVRGFEPDRLARVGLILVPEGRHVFGPLTVHENLQMGETARAGRSGMSLDDVYDLFTPLGALRARRGWSLSGGEQQMVAIGRALVAAPRLLMLDEPSLGLAPIIVNAVYSALSQIKSTVPLLVVEQNTTKALELCDRAYVMVQGAVVVEAPAAELGDRRALLDSYLGQQDIAESGPAGS